MNSRLSIWITATIAMAILLAGCGTFSAGVEAGTGASSIKVFPYQADWSWSMVLNQTVPLSDNGFVMIQHIDDEQYKLERYDHDLSLRWSQSFTTDNEHDEEGPQIFQRGGEILLFFQRKMPFDKWQSVARRFELSSGKLIETKMVCEIEEEVDVEFDYRFSGDSNYTLIYCRGKRIYREGDDRDTILIPYHTCVVDRQLATVQERRIDLVNAVERKSGLYADLGVADNGDIEVGYVHDDGEQYRIGFRRIDSNGNVSIALDDPLPESSLGFEVVVPVQLITTVLPDNSLLGVTRMIDDDETHSLVGVLWSADRKKQEIRELLPVSEELAQRLVDDDELEDYQISDLLTADSGTIVVLLEAYKFTSVTSSKGQTYQKTWYGPILVLTFDRNWALKSTARIDRDETWALGTPSGEFPDFEGSHAAHIAHDTLTLLTREREHDGIVLRQVDLASGHVSEPHVVARLGNMAYFAHRYTAWLPDGEVVIWAKDGRFDDDWKILRVTP
jgi:hypothetical protein